MKSELNPQALLQALQTALQQNDLTRATELAMALAGAGALAITDLFNVTQHLTEKGQPRQSVALFRQWLDHTDSPVAYAALFNMAVTLNNLQDVVGAEAAYRRSLELKPTFLEGHLNLGTLLERKGDFPGAIAMWNEVTALASPAVPADKPFYLQALNNMGRLLEIRKQLPEALQMLTQSLAVDPDQNKVITHLVHLRQKLCQWPIYAPLPGISAETLRQNTSALAMLSASGDPREQLDTARRFVAEKVMPPAATPLAPADGYHHPRLRVGYLSSDLQSHAVAILTAELYELHDRSRVEVYAFSWSNEDGTPLRARVRKAMDHYVPIAHMTDEEAARCIREHEIDILIDLNGLTSGCRPDILSWRPAPVQVTYIGFPGPTGLPCVDYVIADRFLVPPELAQYFTEKLLYMPDTFQINDRQRHINPRPTRAECGLPDDAFVFCSFNNNFKITETIFSSWMRILQRTPGSVLWLVADHDMVRSNLRASAERMGVDPQRLYFANRAAPADYLARYQVADLFLDTDTFNAGTTGSDALWAGLPMLTCTGRTFSSRMAGSLLQAAGLPELITYQLSDYEDVAVRMAQHPSELAALRRRLEEHRLSCPLFDSPRFVRNLEDQLERIAVHPTDEIKQTPMNEVHNADVYNFMRKNYRGVVEVGSSSGALARVYRNDNPSCSYVGIEIDAGYAEASRRHCTEVILGNVEKLPDETINRVGKGADCWIFADALEHLYDPWQMIRRIKASSGPGTEIVACIPNAQYWGLQSILNRGQFFYQDSGILDRTHIRWFTRATIVDLFQANGFRVENMIMRVLNRPSAEMEEALRHMARVSGADPDMAVQEATAFQYVVKAVAV